jgi:hypothetical protein
MDERQSELQDVLGACLRITDFSAQPDCCREGAAGEGCAEGTGRGGLLSSHREVHVVVAGNLRRLFLYRADPSIFSRTMAQFRYTRQSATEKRVGAPMLLPLRLIVSFRCARSLSLSLPRDFRCDVTRFQRCAALESVRD